MSKRPGLVHSDAKKIATESIPSSVLERYFARRSHGGRMFFEGTFELDRAPEVKRCQWAWQQTLMRHPRLHATWTGTGKRQRWTYRTLDLSGNFFSDIENEDELEQLSSPCVRSGRGAVVVVSSNEQNPLIRFRFHHAACDGVGAGRVMADFFAAFHSRQTRPNPSSKPNETDSTDESQVQSPPTPDFRNTWKTIRGRNVRFDTHLHDLDGPSLTISSSGFGLLSEVPLQQIAPQTLGFQLDSATSANLRSRLRQLSIPLNDFAVAATSMALADLSRHFASSRMHLMVMNPVAMRTWASRRSSANHLGFAFIRRRHSELEWSGLDGIDEALHSVHKELHDVRAKGIAGELVWGIGLMEKLPGALSAVERMGWFTPTASVTCLSSIRFARRYGFIGKRGDGGASIGDAKIKSFTGSGPLQSGGQLAVTVCDLGGPIGWSFRTAKPIVESKHQITQIASSIHQLSKHVSCKPS